MSVPVVSTYLSSLQSSGSWVSCYSRISGFSLSPLVDKDKTYPVLYNGTIKKVHGVRALIKSRCCFLLTTAPPLPRGPLTPCSPLFPWKRKQTQRLVIWTPHLKSKILILNFEIKIKNKLFDLGAKLTWLSDHTRDSHWTLWEKTHFYQLKLIWIKNQIHYLHRRDRTEELTSCPGSPSLPGIPSRPLLPWQEGESHK